MGYRILVVDDNSAVLLSMAFLLRRAGFEVTQSTNGHEALKEMLYAQRKGRPYDLLITDNQMPEMSGRELFLEVRLYFPSLPVFVMSGAWDEGLAEELSRDGRAVFLLKPMEIQDLVEWVRNVLDSQGGCPPRDSTRLVS